MVWNRVAQGSKNGPQAWGRMSALISRLAQALFAASELQLHTYTDDPIATMCGAQDEINLHTTILVLTWRVLGFKLAFRKGQLNHAVTWVGYDIFTNVARQLIEVTIKKEFLEELLATTEKLLKHNQVGKRELRSYTGRANHVANMVWVLKPFLEELWAAVEATASSNAARGCVWRKQIQNALTWIRSFLLMQRGPLRREWHLSSFVDKVISVMMAFDASPWGIGAVLLINGIPTQYFSSRLSRHDEIRYQYRIGDSSGQQTWEALAILAALRAWRKYWINVKVTLSVQGDNVAALTMAMKLKAQPGAMKAIAREMALEFSHSCIMPHIVQHVPGLTNVLADKLSRKFEPNALFSLPEALKLAEEIQLPIRDEAYYFLDFRAERRKRRR